MSRPVQSLARAGIIVLGTVAARFLIDFGHPAIGVIVASLSGVLFGYVRHGKGAAA